MHMPMKRQVLPTTYKCDNKIRVAATRFLFRAVQKRYLPNDFPGSKFALNVAGEGFRLREMLNGGSEVGVTPNKPCQVSFHMQACLVSTAGMCNRQLTGLPKCYFSIYSHWTPS